jgi:hypothetical protein
MIALSLLFSAALLLGAEARAQTAQAPAAEALFREGREAMGRGDIATACAKFSESQRMDPSPGTLLNLAVCEEKRGLLASSWAHFRELMDVLPQGDDRRAFAASRAEELRSRVPRLRLRPSPGTPAEMVVTLNGSVLGAASMGTLLPMDPGLQTITIDSPGRRRVTLQVTLQAGEIAERTLSPGPLEAPSSLPPPPPSGSSLLRPISYGLAGFSAAALVMTVVSGVLVLSKKQMVEEHCREGYCDQEGLSAAAGGAAVVLFSWSAGASPRSTAALHPGGGMLVLTTRF